jgi:hypothetical protein
MEISIAFLVFKRPNMTQKVFDAIRQAKPSKLLVVADGPRDDRPGEAEKCAETRAVINQVDWDCEVLKNYSDENLGCRKRVSSGLDWVFSLVNQAIILEDDCVPQASFFPYCEELLERYREDERIMSICGLSVPTSYRRDSFSYCFSRYQRCWGWATWKRAWQYYDHDMELWPHVLETKLLNDLFLDKTTADFWCKKFQDVYVGKINSWAYRWMFSCWLQNGLSILPEVNLIENIGFGSDATNTVSAGLGVQSYSQEIRFPLRHPNFVLSDRRADEFIQRTRHNPRLVDRLENKLKKLLHA